MENLLIAELTSNHQSQLLQRHYCIIIYYINFDMVLTPSGLLPTDFYQLKPAYLFILFLCKIII